ncbi:MAG: hypothetical protein ACI4JW_08670 [Oscillospiraceae bacterium]
MNPKRKQAIELLDQAVQNVSDVKIKTDIQSLGELSEAFLNTDNKAERKRLAADFKKRHEELHRFLADNPDLVNAEVERALLSAALGGEFVDEEIKIDSGGRRSVRRTKKTIAPNAAAAAKWLENKDKENWSPNPKADPELEDTSEIEEELYGKK